MILFDDESTDKAKVNVGFDENIWTKLNLVEEHHHHLSTVLFCVKPNYGGTSPQHIF